MPSRRGRRLTRSIASSLHVLVLAVLLAGAFPAASSAGLIGVTFDGRVYDISPTTGAGTLLGSSGFSRLNSAASDGSGSVYTATSPFEGLGGELITIDPATGVGTSVAGLGDQFNGIRGLAFAPDGALYAVVDVGPPGSLGPDSLFVVDPSTGSLALVGATGQTSLQGLAFDPGGRLFGWCLGLCSIDRVTGTATRISDGPGFQNLEFSPDGTLYTAYDSLFTISTATGAATLVGGGGYSDIRGLAYTEPSAVPEPSTIGLLGLGLIKLARSTRRKRVR